MPLGQRFDAQKAVEAILYICSNVEDSTMLRISKILYFAEKRQLAEKGVLITGDYYYALPKGPVPTEIYNLLKTVRGDENHPAGDLAKEAVSIIRKCRVVAKRKPDISYLSKADLQSLDFSIAAYGRMPDKELSDISHDASYDAAESNGRIPLAALAFGSPNEQELSKFLSDPFPGEESYPEEDSITPAL